MKRMGPSWLVALTSLVLLVFPTAAVADDGNRSYGDRPVSEEWSATITPFSGWVPGLNGTVGAFGTRAKVSVTPIEILRNIGDFVDVLDGIYIGWGEIRYQKFGFFFDVFHVNVSSVDSFSAGGVSGNLDLRFRQTTATLAATYRLMRDPRGHLDAMAGARIWDVNMRVGVDVDDIGLSVGTGDNWVDGVIGLKGRYVLDPRWSISGWGLVGAGGSDITWDLYGGLTYAVRPGFDLTVGFRGLKADYKTEDFEWKMLQYGPVVNATLKF